MVPLEMPFQILFGVEPHSVTVLPPTDKVAIGSDDGILLEEVDGGSGRLREEWIDGTPFFTRIFGIDDL